VLPVAFSLTFRYGAGRGLLAAKPVAADNFPDLWLSDNTHPIRFNDSRCSGRLCYPSSSPQVDLEGAMCLAEPRCRTWAPVSPIPSN